MLYNTFHNRWLRLIAAVAGEFIAALGINLFIVPLGLYSGGTLGVCQLIRTLMQTYLHLDFGGYDIAGILYFLSNIPILIFAYKVLGTGHADNRLHGVLFRFLQSDPHPRSAHCG